MALHHGNYFMQYCKQPFSVTAFLQHKLKYAQPRLTITCYASGKKQVYTDTSNQELFETLKRWRDIACEETGIPIYMVANQHTLKEISTYLPLSKKDLLQISGFGKAKVDKYGDEIISAVESYCQQFNIETNMAARAINPKRERKEKNTDVKTDTKLASFTLFKEGKSIPEIALERNLASSTIESHLAYFIGTGEIDINDFVNNEKQQKIKEAAAIHGTLSHKTLLENLPQGISYGDLKMVLATEKK